MGPFLAMFLFLRFHASPGPPFKYDSWAIVAAVAIGLVALNTFRFRIAIRIGVSLLYSVLMAAGVFVFGLEYVCGVYHSCL